MVDRGLLKCRLCYNEQNNHVFSVKEMMFGSGEKFDYLECGKCKTIQIVTIPENLGKYYPENYYSFGGLNKSSDLKRLIKAFRYGLFRYTELDVFKHYHYGDWLKELNLPFTSKIADVGCGNGQLLYEFYAAGYKDLVGIDPFMDSDKKINSKLHLLKKSIFELEEKFDCIMMHHSFEHMDNPNGVIKKASELLNKGGKLLIRIPIADKVAWKEYGENWVQLDAPRHIYIHSEASLVNLAAISGLSLEKKVYDSTSFQFWGSELYKLGVSLYEARNKKYFSKERMIEFEKKSLKLNAEGQGDQACFYFRKD